MPGKVRSVTVTTPNHPRTIRLQVGPWAPQYNPRGLYVLDFLSDNVFWPHLMRFLPQTWNQLILQETLVSFVRK